LITPLVAAATAQTSRGGLDKPRLDKARLELEG